MKIFILTSLFLILASCSPGNQTDVLDDVGFFISRSMNRSHYNGLYAHNDYLILRVQKFPPHIAKVDDTIMPTYFLPTNINAKDNCYYLFKFFAAGIRSGQAMPRIDCSEKESDMPNL